MITLLNPRPVAVSCLDGHELKITFSNGEVGIYSVKPILNFGVFKKLVDESYFKLARVENGTVTWPHEQDICPDTLYLDSNKSAQQGDAPEKVSLKLCYDASPQNLINTSPVILNVGQIKS
jgi:hypothetical protein